MSEFYGYGFLGAGVAMIFGGLFYLLGAVLVVAIIKFLVIGLSS